MTSVRLIAVAVLGLPSALLIAEPPLDVYLDSLDPGWVDWSWSTTRSFSNTSPRKGGSGASIRVKHDAAWAGLFLHSNQPLPAAGLVTLKFSIHGGTAGGHRVQLLAYNSSGGTGTAIALPLTTANTWVDREVPVASLGVSEITGLVWQDAGGAAHISNYYLDDIQITREELPPLPLAVSIDVSAGRHPISPLIYGLNFADAGLAAELALPVNRWGGNATTRYNWQTDVSNRASDWYFENIPDSNPNPGQLPNGSQADRFVERNLASGTDTIMTVPLIGWTPKPPRTITCGFSVAKYGPQEDTDPYRADCGNGNHSDGSPITGNDPTDTSMAIGPDFVTAWINHLVGRYGPAGAGGVRFYNLDNEPMLWPHTHRDVHPQLTSYDEMRDRTYAYAAAIKATDPGAQTLGPVLWGWTAYFYSAADQAGGGAWWNQRPDRKAHGDVPFVEWYLQQMQAYEQTYGTRILDYFDLHYYPQSGVALAGAGDAATQAKRLRSTRSLWDATYSDESWIAEPVRLIPRMRDWVNSRYPGTKLAMTEYNFGAIDHINGAVTQADVLGIFGREGLDLATLWDPPSASEPTAYAFRMYRNYDAAGGRFGQTSVHAVSADQSIVSVYAAQRQDGRLTIMLINKSTALQAPRLAITGFEAGTARVYRYSAANLNAIVRLADLPIVAGENELSLPAASVTLLVIPPAAYPPGDFDEDTDVDAADLAHFIDCAAGPALQPKPGCTHADLDGDSDVDQRDFGLWQRCMTAPGVSAAMDCLD